MKSVLGKLALARTFIKSHPLKKDGTNTFSNYDYFTPEIVSKLVNAACFETNIICVFDLAKDELGYFGKLTTTDLETGDELVTIMRTEKPVIKATNETQQMGGMNTYTKRYCLMSLFDIEDNSMDFDSDASQKNKEKPANKENKVNGNEPDKPWLNLNTKEFEGAVKKLREGKTTIAKIREVMKVSKAVEAELNEALKLETSKN